MCPPEFCNQLTGFHENLKGTLFPWKSPLEVTLEPTIKHWDET